MPAAIAFFPWVTLSETIEVGPIRLCPYFRRKFPGDQQGMTQADIDGVLRAYSRKPASTKKDAVILEVDEWRTGMEASQNILSRLFEARHLIAFSAMARRRFHSHLEYSNFDTYRLVVQKFAPGSTQSFALVTRRRDGTTTHVWGSDEFSFRLPHHVDPSAALNVDAALLGALVRLPKELSHIVGAIRDFDNANTDSNDVTEVAEMVMMKAAFESLFEIKITAKLFQHALINCLQGIPMIEIPDGPEALRWKEKWNRERPIEAWARDFCAVRGSAAHGNKGNAHGASVWSESRHLLFAALLFPLLVKKILRDRGLIEMDAFDLERLRRVDAYLMHDPFAPRSRAEKHPWTEVDKKALYAARAPKLYAVAKAALAASQ